MELQDRIWLVGRTGRVGAALNHTLSSRNMVHQLVATDIEDVDITNLVAVEKFVERYRPSTIINCAAKRDKVWCEENPDEAFRINALGARNLAIASLQTGAHLIHISSDYVFDGMTRKSYKEYSATNPINIYGKSMNFAEELIKQTTARHTIIRSSRLYGKRLLMNIIDEARDTGRIHYDQELTMTPISSLTLAELVLQFIDTSEFGTYHLGSEDIATAREFIEEVLSVTDIEAELLIADDFKDSVQRPKHLVFSRTMLKLIGKDIETTWKDDLHRFMRIRKVG